MLPHDGGDLLPTRAVERSDEGARNGWLRRKWRHDRLASSRKIAVIPQSERSRPAVLVRRKEKGGSPSGLDDGSAFGKIGKPVKRPHNRRVGLSPDVQTGDRPGVAREERPLRLLERRPREILVDAVNHDAEALESIGEVRLVRMLSPRPRNKPSHDRDPRPGLRPRRCGTRRLGRNNLRAREVERNLELWLNPDPKPPHGVFGRRQAGLFHARLHALPGHGSLGFLEGRLGSLSQRVFALGSILRRRRHAFPERVLLWGGAPRPAWNFSAEGRRDQEFPLQIQALLKLF